MVPQTAENREKPVGDNHNTPSASVENTQTGNDSEKPDNAQIQPTAKESPSIKPDLMSMLEEKDRKNREEALCNVISDAKKLMKDTDIPPVELTPFEESLMYYLMLSGLDYRHYEFFGIPEGQGMTEDIRLNLYNSLSDEQKNTLKRDFLIGNMIQGTGISKRAALLVELAKYHFPDDMTVIEHDRNGEYLKKWEVIREQMDKIQPKSEELKEIA